PEWQHGKDLGGRPWRDNGIHRESALMNKAITFAALKALLEHLGSQEAVLPSGHIVFSYREGKDRLLFYRAYRPDEVLDWADKAKTSRFLDAWGFVDEKAFDRLLQDPAA